MRKDFSVLKLFFTYKDDFLHHALKDRKLKWLEYQKAFRESEKE